MTIYHPLRLLTLLLGICLVAACGGGGGSGSIDYSSATVVEDLQTQLTALDSNIKVVSNGNGSISLTSGSDTIVIKPGTASSAVITLSGTMYNVQISASGEYTYSPANSPASTADYITSAKSLVSDLDDVSTKLKVDPATGVVNLSEGTKNSSASSVPDQVKLSGTGTGTISGSLSGWSTSGNLASSQEFKIDHNLTDTSVKEAHKAGWDGTGVNITVLDGKTASWSTDYDINQTVSATVTLTDGETTETVSDTDTAKVNFSLSHGALVYGIATGLDWKAALEGVYSVAMNSDCTGSTSTETVDQLTTKTSINISSNHCGKIGVATGANGSFYEILESGAGADSHAKWDDLIKQKNTSGKIEILNYSFGSTRSGDLDFDDNKNVLIVTSAGNDSEVNNGYDIFADGKNVDQSTDIYEIMEVSLANSKFANNMIAVGALDADDKIAIYSTIAGPDYDGSSYAFIVDDGTVKIDFDTATSFSGDLSMTKDGRTLSGTYQGSVVESLKISTQGTSFAAPRVTGKMAITSQKFPNLNAEQLVNLAKHTAIDLGETGVDQIYGHGKVNLTGMLSPIGRLN